MLVVRGTTPRVAPNTKYYKYKILTLCVLQNPITKCANTEANKVARKPTIEILHLINTFSFTGKFRIHSFVLQLHVC